MVLYDGSSTTLDCQNARHLTDDILWRRPSRQLASQPNSNHLQDHGPGILGQHKEYPKPSTTESLTTTVVWHGRKQK